MGDPLGKYIPFLPDILRKNGYRTAAFVGALALEPRKLAPGFERGFDIYDAGFHRRGPHEDRYHSLERRGEEVVESRSGLAEQTIRRTVFSLGAPLRPS